MKQCVNFISHYRNVNQLLYENNSLNSTHIALYNALLQLWNNCGFEENLSINRNDVMNLSKIGSSNTYIKCLKDLDSEKFLKYVPSHNPLKGSIINLFRFDTTTEQVVNKYCTSSDTTTDTTTDNSSESLYKLLNNNIILLINNNISLVNENLEKWIDEYNKPKTKKEKIIDTLFKDIKTPPENINKQYFYLAKYFHKVFINYHGENKSLNSWKLNDTINDVRKLVEVDLQPIRRLFAFSHFFENDTSEFWIKNSYSLKSLRKSNGGIFKYDQLKTQIESFYENNPKILNDYNNRYQNFLKLVE